MTLEIPNRKIFHSKHKIINLILGRVNEIVKETHKAWVKFFAANHGFYTSLKPNTNTQTSPLKGKVKVLWVLHHQF